MSNKWYGRKTSADQGLISDEITGRNIAVAYDCNDTALLAAAPELLEALEAIVLLAEDQGRRNLPECRSLALQAIAKAKGE
jgi:hypothetical protein